MILLIRVNLPGFPPYSEKGGTTVSGGKYELSNILALSFIITRWDYHYYNPVTNNITITQLLPILTFEPILAAHTIVEDPIIT